MIYIGNFYNHYDEFILIITTIAITYQQLLKILILLFIFYEYKFYNIIKQ